MAATTAVLFPCSPGEAIEAFGDGDGVRILAGGTLLVPELHLRGGAPEQVVALSGAGLDFVKEPCDGEIMARVGAMTPVDRLCTQPAPIGPAARGIGDGEIRAAATLGGNLCAPAGFGDLQAPLLALDASARSAGSDRERTESLEDFLAARDGRLLLEVSYVAPLEMGGGMHLRTTTDGRRVFDDSHYSRPAAGAFASLGRPHAHHFTVMSVSGVRTVGGEVRLAAVGVGPVGVRLRAAEALAHDPEAAGAAAAEEVNPSDDPLASGWYRRRTLPSLVRRVLSELEVGS